jgi:hypothetical protein
MAWWDDLVDDAIEGGVKGGLKWAWSRIGPRKEGEPKTVSLSYPARTGLLAQAEGEGFEMHWFAARHVDERLGDGWQYVYEPDARANTKHRLVAWDKSALLIRQRNAAG